METKSRIYKISPWDKVGILKKLFFTWVYPVFWRGLRTPLGWEDLYRPSKADEARKLCALLEKNWNLELTKKHPSYARAMSKTFVVMLIPVVIIMIIYECGIRVYQTMLLGNVIEFFGNPKGDYTKACLEAAGICVCTLIITVMGHMAGLLALRVGMKMRAASNCLIYKKSLKLSKTGIGETTIGQIVNLMSNDVNKFDDFSILSNFIIVGPAQGIIMMYLIFEKIGWSSMVGVGVLILFIPFQGFMGKCFSSIRSKTAQLTDNRIRLMNEILSGMRVIKFYAWEKPFSLLVSEARRKEIGRIRKACLLKAVNLSIFFAASKFIIFASFITYVLTGGILDSQSVFVTISFFNTLRVTLTLLFPYGIEYTANSLVSCKRIQRFLMLGEIESSLPIELNSEIKTKNEDNMKQQKSEVKVEKIKASWGKQSDFMLENISVSVNPGELLAVVGPVGSGKTSFLMALLKELPLSSGSIRMKGKVAYASQESWSFNGSVRENILLGKEFNDVKYRRVVHVCALERDFKLFPFGDRTLVGEKGVSLSGGQKARITLARCLYQDADIYLLDDPLSAVDASVAKHIFEKCISGYLKRKVCVLVTHQMQFIKKVSKVLVLKEGKCMGYGSYDDLVNTGIDFISLIGDEKENEEKQKENNSEMRERTYSSISTRSNKMLRSISYTGSQSSNFNLCGDEEDNPEIGEEGHQTGAVKSKVYSDYFSAGSGPVFLLITILSTIVSQLIFHASDVFLTQWVNEEQRIKNKQNNTIPDNTTTFDFTSYSTSNGTSDVPEKVDEQYYSIIYTALIVLLFISVFIRSITFFMMCMKASIKLHNRIFYQILRCPIYFFDNNPVGRILNRFSRDLGTIDEQMPATAYDLNLTLTAAVGICIVVALVQPYLIIAGFSLLFMTLMARRLYIRAFRDIKRYEGLTRSPLYSHLSTTLNGLTTVRSFCAQNEFTEQFYNYQDDHTACWWLFLCCSRTIGFLVDGFCFIYISVITVVLMMLHKNIESGSFGLALSSALALAGSTQWGVRQSAELESQMTCVERILEYSEIEPEGILEAEDDKKPTEIWPQKGDIEFKEVTLVYDGLPKPALNNLNFVVSGGEKIGIVGRTGAGKSSLLAALFRMCEPDGIIQIDGIDTRSIGLHDLRKKISIIPQDPVIFTGSVRYNLDPFREHSDEILWIVLEEVQLKEVVCDLKNGLDAMLTEGGSNLSVGQRQLVCLARAILRRNKVLVLDEATANVDHHTDATIQNTIRDKFNECTVLTIAHRLNTIIDSDRVMVLDAGTIVEFDHPHILLQCNEGHFSSMIQQTGPLMASQLHSAAKDAYNKIDKN